MMVMISLKATAVVVAAIAMKGLFMYSTTPKIYNLKNNKNPSRRF